MPQRQALETLAQQTRLLAIVKQGRSTLYQVHNRQALADYLRQLQPLDVADLPEHAPTRSHNLALHRSSKKGKSGHAAYYLLMKAWADGVLWQGGSNVLDVTQATRQFGAAALQVGTEQAWHCSRPLLLVENQALFDQTDWLAENFDGCLVYYAGQLPELLLQWLAERPRSPQLTLFPDYDGIGLSNYARLAKTLHAETTLCFYWMAGWQDKLPQFGDAELWQRTREKFAAAYQELHGLQRVDRELSQLAEMAQWHGKALEQEAVWL